MRRTISPASRAQSFQHCAFSLVELLVTTTAVALLLAMVAPSLELARQRSKTFVCLERLRAIGAASASYAADDPQDWGIPVHGLQYEQCVPQPSCAKPPCCPPCLQPTSIGAYEWGGKSGVGSPGWIQPPGPLGSRYGTRAGFGPATRPLNQYIYPHGFRDHLDPFNRIGASLDTELVLDAFRCPADDGPPLGAHCPDWLANPRQTSYDHYGNSFAANLFMIASAGSGGEMRSNSPYLRPISRTPNPIRTIMYEENIGRWAWACRREQCQILPGLQPGVDPGPTGALRGWHGKDWTYNRAFIDAHAERQKVYIEGTEDQEHYAQHYVNEHLESYPDFPRCCAEVGGPGSFERYQCIIIRGPGWQKDTMPGELICTGLSWKLGGRPSYEDCVTNFPQNTADSANHDSGIR